MNRLLFRNVQVCSVTENVFRRLWNMRVHYSVNNSMTPVPNLSQMNSVDTLST